MNLISFHNLLVVLELTLALGQNILSDGTLTSDQIFTDKKNDNSDIILGDNGAEELMEKSSNIDSLVPSPTTVRIDHGNNVTEYEVISYWLTNKENGDEYTASSSSVYSPPAITTSTLTNKKEYYVEKDVISYFITTNEQREIITDRTVVKSSQVATIHSTLTYPQSDMTVYAVMIFSRETITGIDSTHVDWNAGYISYIVTPALRTFTTTNEKGYTEIDVQSYYVTYEQFHVYVTNTTYQHYTEMINEQSSDYTTVVTHTDGSVETDSVHYVNTTDSNGTTTVVPITSKIEGPGEHYSDYTTVVTHTDGSVETDSVHYVNTTDSNGATTVVPITSKIEGPGEHYSDYTTVVTHTDGSVETDSVHYVNTTDSNGATTVVPITSKIEGPGEHYSDYTTVVTHTDGSVETDSVHYVNTTDSNGISTVVPITSKIEGPGEHYSDYTTVVTHTDGSVETDSVHYVNTTDSNGISTVVPITSKIEGPGEHYSDYTTVVTHTDGSVETDSVHYVNTTDSNGISTVVPITSKIEGPGEHYSDYTTVVTHTDGSVETDSVHYVNTTDSNGATTVVPITSKIEGPGEHYSDYTTVVTHTDGSVETDSVHFVTTIDSAGKPVVFTSTFQIGCSNDGDNNGGNPSFSSSSIDRGKDNYTTSMIHSDGSIDTEVAQHVTTRNTADNIIMTAVTELPASTIENTGYVSNGETIHKEIIISLYTDSDGHIATFTWTKLYKTLASANSVSLSSEQQSSTRLSTTSSTNSLKSVTPANIPSSSGTAINNFNDQLTVITTNGQELTAVVSDVTTTDDNGNPITPTKIVPTTLASSGPISVTSVTYGSHPTSQSIISPDIGSQQLHNAAISVDTVPLHFYLFSLVALLLI
ncbi:hypothetical protein RNJ44_00851 [Nakaseomyces bracarensis]|uniref:Uncharacterized protein n=1 Tax=Nakaseomyces bracarensis TaxID=273131 RepID=A0ABR4NSF4_9SACH